MKIQSKTNKIRDTIRILPRYDRILYNPVIKARDIRK